MEENKIVYSKIVIQARCGWILLLFQNVVGAFMLPIFIASVCCESAWTAVTV